MDLSAIGASLRARAEELNLSNTELAQRAGCSVLDVARLFSGEPTAKAGVLVAVADALGYAVLTLPKPAAQGIRSGLDVTEPQVETVVSKALSQLKTRSGPSAQRVVLFLDCDGVVHGRNDSRIDERGQLAGDKLFCWCPHLQSVLKEFPQVEVVVHSSWRKHWPNLELMRAQLPEELAARVVGVTDHEVEGRQESIEAYLANHPDVGAFVILDDRPADFDVDHPNLVACHTKRGLRDLQTVQRLRSALENAVAQVSL